MASFDAPDFSTPGAHTSEEGRTFAEWLVRRFRDLQALNEPRYVRSLRHYANYVADPAIKDPRDPIKDRWRSFVMPPKAWANTNTSAAVVSDIITSVSPMIQATRRKDLKAEVAKYAENVCTYTLAGNKFRTRILPVLARSAEIQGSQIIKMSYIDRSRLVTYLPSNSERDTFWNACLIAAQQSGTPMPDRRVDPQAHDAWLEVMRAAGQQIPDFPTPGLFSSNAYAGPWYTLPNEWNIAFDPFVADMQAQEVIFERIVMPCSYVDSLSKKDDPNAIFDHEAVQKAREGGRPERFNTWDRDYYRIMGLDTGKYPTFDYAPYDVLLEAHMVNHPDVKLGVILNNQLLINKKVDVGMPFGDAPYVDTQRVRMQNLAKGLSPYTPTESLLYEGVALRSSRLDAIQIATNPSWAVAGSGIGGITSINKLTPGAIYPNIPRDSFSPIVSKVPDAAFREDSQNAFDIDEGWGIDASMRGQQASTGRVSLGEYQGRRTQATLPLIEVAREIEDALATTIPWIFRCFQAFAPEGTLLKIAGGEVAEVDRSMLAEALKLDLDFAGATQTRNKAEQAQIALMLVDKFANDMGPIEKRGALKVLWSLNGLPGAEELLDDATGQALQSKVLGIPPPLAAGNVVPPPANGAPQSPILPPAPQDPDAVAVPPAAPGA